jgi:hypothetical protein
MDSPNVEQDRGFDIWISRRRQTKRVLLVLNQVVRVIRLMRGEIIST